MDPHPGEPQLGHCLHMWLGHAYPANLLTFSKQLQACRFFFFLLKSRLKEQDLTISHEQDWGSLKKPPLHATFPGLLHFVSLKVLNAGYKRKVFTSSSPFTSTHHHTFAHKPHPLDRHVIRKTECQSRDTLAVNTPFHAFFCPSMNTGCRVTFFVLP